MTAVVYLKHVERHWIQGKNVTDWMDKLSEMSYAELKERRDIFTAALEAAPHCYEDDILLLIQLTKKFMAAAMETIARHMDNSPPPYNPESDQEYLPIPEEAPKRPMTVLQAHHARIEKSKSPWAIFMG